MFLCQLRLEADSFLCKLSTFFFLVCFKRIFKVNMFITKATVLFYKLQTRTEYAGIKLIIIHLFIIYCFQFQNNIGDTLERKFNSLWQIIDPKTCENPAVI